MKVLPFGDSNLLINFEQEVDPEVNALVHQLSRHLRNHFQEGLLSIVPAYCSLTVTFDPEALTADMISKVAESFTGKEQTVENSLLKIPVCYEVSHGPDLAWVADYKKLDSIDIINLHTSREYLVYMLGFLPGFPYLGGLPKTLYMPRKEVPRKSVATGSVGLAGMQTGIYPVQSPGGWQLIGTTPVRIFQYDKEEPFIIRNGDRIRFYSISAGQFDELKVKDLSRTDLYDTL